MWMMFLDFTSAFNTIQPLILTENLKKMGEDSIFISWIHNYMTERLLYVRLGVSVSRTMVSIFGTPHGTVLSPFFSTLYTADFAYTDMLKKENPTMVNEITRN